MTEEQKTWTLICAQIYASELARREAHLFELTRRERDHMMEHSQEAADTIIEAARVAEFD